MSYWLFQANTEEYDLRSAEAIVRGKTELWRAPQHARDIRQGDTVFLWLAGQDHVRGIYGWGTIEAPVATGSDGKVVPIRIVEKFRRHIPVSEIRADEDLQDLYILRNPRGR